MIPGATPALAAEIESDRPELTESAKLVPRGAVQMESGVAYSRERRAGRPTETTFEAGADFRIGVTRSVELNLGWDPLVRVRGAEDDTGIGDVTVGVREIAVDVGLQTSLVGQAPDYVVRTGLSVLWR